MIFWMLGVVVSFEFGFVGYFASHFACGVKIGIEWVPVALSQI